MDARLVSGSLRYAGLVGVWLSLGCHDVTSSPGGERYAVTQGDPTDSADPTFEDPGSNGDASVPSTTPPPPSMPEICNFRDDNNDHQVDEGFDWVVSEWTTFATGQWCSGNPRAISLSDGRVAVVATDAYGEHRDRGLLAFFSSAGELLGEPIWTPIPGAGGPIGTLAEGPDGQVAALYDSTDYKSCAEACPITLTRVDRDGALIGTNVLELGFEPYQAWDIIWVPPAYVALVRQRSTLIPHIVRINPKTGAVSSVTSLPVSPVHHGSLTFAQEGGFGWIVSAEPLNPAAQVTFGFDNKHSGCRYESTELEPLMLASSSSRGIGTDGFSRNLAHSFDFNFFATYNMEVDGVLQPELVRIKCSNVIGGPIPAGPPGTVAQDILLLENKSVVVLSQPIGHAYAFLRRLRTDISKLDPPAPDLEIEMNSSGISMARVEDGILVFKSTGCDPKSFDVAKISCASGAPADAGLVE